MINYTQSNKIGTPKGLTSLHPPSQRTPTLKWFLQEFWHLLLPKYSTLFFSIEVNNCYWSIEKKIKSCSPNAQRQEPKFLQKPLPKLSYIMSSYSSSPKGTLRLETITPLCKIAPLQRSHPIATLLPTHYERFNYLVMNLHKKSFTKKPATVVAVFLCSFFCTNHH